MEIEAILKKYVAEELLNGSVDVEVSDNLLADGMVDSMGMLRLVNHIETLLNIKIPHADLVIENFRTIEVIAEYLKRRNVSHTAN